MDMSRKAAQFRALHERPQAFLMPNPWDAGSARILASAGFEALATTSSGFAFSRGRRDYGITRDMALEHLRLVVSATDLPINADLENGFGAAPETCAETIRLAAESGVAGGSIEDTTGGEEAPIFPIEQAAERVRAAVEAARSLPFDFVLTARAENYLHGRPDLRDTIRRLQAYQQAGADVLYAPGMTAREDIATLLREVDRPVNLLAGIKGMALNAAELSALGVRRISLGGSLARVAATALLRAATEMQQQGTFSFLESAISSSELDKLLR